MSGASKNRKPPSYYVEWGYVKGRSFTLNFLALGSMLVFYRIGTSVGEMTFPDSTRMLFLTRVAFVAMAYYAVDWVLKVVLTDASTVAQQSADLFDINGHKITVVQRNLQNVWRVGIAALVITTGISVVSNWFVSSDLSGKSHLLTYQQQLLTSMATDTTLKQQALSLLARVGDKQSELLTQAGAEQKRLLDEAVNATKSESWKRDYYRHRSNPKAWFWTCGECPSGYRVYRDNIKTAIEQGNALVAQASGYSQMLTTTLSPTLSHNPSRDSTLIELKSTTTLLEAERKKKESYLNTILLVMTLAGAVMTLLLTYLLRKHRKVNGQLINDNPTRFLMIASDIGNRVRKVLSDILYTITFNLHEKAVRNGWLVTYTVEDTHITEELHATVQGEKRCLYCDAKLVNKRSDAKYCDDDCRTNYHAHKRRVAT